MKNAWTTLALTMNERRDPLGNESVASDLSSLPHNFFELYL